MSYKLKEGISPRPSIIEMADFWEVQCLKRLDTPVSSLTISKSFGIPEDVQETDEEGIDEFKKESEIEDIISEIQRRKSSCAGKYPFKLDVHQNILSINGDVPE